MLDLPKFNKSSEKTGKISVIFQKIRLDQIICDQNDKKIIEQDSIIPKSWIDKAKIKNWDKIISFRGHDVSFVGQELSSNILNLEDQYSTKTLHDLNSEIDLADLANYLSDSTDEIILPAGSDNRNSNHVKCVTKNTSKFFQNRWRLGRKLPNFREDYTWHWAYYTFGLNLQFKWNMFEGIKVSRVPRFDNSEVAGLNEGSHN